MGRAALLCTLFGAHVGVANQQACGATFDAAAIYRRVRDSVVQVACDDVRGTGLLWQRADRVVTARHLVACRGGPVVTTAGGHRLAARVLRHNDRLDLAQLSLPRAAGGQPLPRAAKPVVVGDRVCLIGHPFPHLEPRQDGTPQLSHNFSCGRVSNRLAAQIITDAPVNPGVSGGPLLDASGRLVGVVIQKLRGADNIGRARDLQAIDLLLAEKPGAPLVVPRRVIIGAGYALRANLSDGGARHGPSLSMNLELPRRLEVGLHVGLTFSSPANATASVGLASKDLELATQLAFRPQFEVWGRTLRPVLGVQAGGVARFASETLLVLSDEDACPELSDHCRAGRVESRAQDPRGKALFRPWVGISLGRLELTVQLDVLLPGAEFALGGGLNLRL